MKIKLIQTMETDYQNYEYKGPILDLKKDIKQNNCIEISKNNIHILINSTYIMTIEL